MIRTIHGNFRVMRDEQRLNQVTKEVGLNYNLASQHPKGMEIKQERREKRKSRAMIVKEAEKRISSSWKQVFRLRQNKLTTQTISTWPFI